MFIVYRNLNFQKDVIFITLNSCISILIKLNIAKICLYTFLHLNRTLAIILPYQKLSRLSRWSCLRNNEIQGYSKLN
jgi:hypothetical protein